MKNDASLETAIARILEHRYECDRVIVVVSAMGRFPDSYATDTLASLATHLTPKHKDRLISVGELISALVLENKCLQHSLDACALTIAETGIITDDNYQKGHVLAVSDKVLKQALREHEILIIPGFTGTSLTGNTVTLGRGGSDYSAFLIAEALHVPFVTIYTDVKGIYDQDPHQHPEAKMIHQMSFDDLLELIEQGAKVMQKESVLYAKRKNISFEVCSTFSGRPGTLVCNQNQECSCK